MTVVLGRKQWATSLNSSAANPTKSGLLFRAGQSCMSTGITPVGNEVTGRSSEG